MRTRLNTKNSNRQKSQYLIKECDDNASINYSEESDLVIVNISNFVCDGAYYINVYFFDGTHVMSKKANKDKAMIYLDELPQGVYIVSVGRNKNFFSKRIIKKH